MTALLLVAALAAAVPLCLVGWALLLLIFGEAAPLAVASILLLPVFGWRGMALSLALAIAPRVILPARRADQQR